MTEIIEKKEIELLGSTYTVYIKEVATKLGLNGVVAATTKRVFVKKNDGGKQNERSY